MITRNPRVVARALTDGRGVLLHLDTSGYHGLNPTGWRIWSLLDEAVTLPQLVGRLSAEMGTEAPTLARDTELFVESLAARGLVQVDAEAQ